MNSQRNFNQGNSSVCIEDTIIVFLFLFFYQSNSVKIIFYTLVVMWTLKQKLLNRIIYSPMVFTGLHWRRDKDELQAWQLSVGLDQPSGIPRSSMKQ